jgi:hypothetical protein
MFVRTLVIIMFGEIICSTRLREYDFQLEFGNNNYEHIVKFKISIKKIV